MISEPGSEEQSGTGLPAGSVIVNHGTRTLIIHFRVFVGRKQR